MCFLKSSILLMFFNLFGTVFHIRLTWVQHLKVLALVNFNSRLLRRSYRVFFNSKKSFMIVGLKLFIDLCISINNVFMLFSWTYHELSFNSRSSKFVSSILQTRRRVLYLIVWSFITKHLDQRALFKSWHNISFR